MRVHQGTNAKDNFMLCMIRLSKMDGGVPVSSFPVLSL